MSQVQKLFNIASIFVFTPLLSLSLAQADDGSWKAIAYNGQGAAVVVLRDTRHEAFIAAQRICNERFQNSCHVGVSVRGNWQIFLLLNSGQLATMGVAPDGTATKTDLRYEGLARKSPVFELVDQW